MRAKMIVLESPPRARLFLGNGSDVHHVQHGIMLWHQHDITLWHQHDITLGIMLISTWLQNRLARSWYQHDSNLIPCLTSKWYHSGHHVNVNIVSRCSLLKLCWYQHGAQRDINLIPCWCHKMISCFISWLGYHVRRDQRSINLTVFSRVGFSIWTNSHEVRLSTFKGHEMFS